MAYFDNAATTFPKPEEVYRKMDEFYRLSGGSAGRGSYTLSQNTGALLRDTRERIGRVLDAGAKQVIFTATATIALNMVIQGVIEKGARTVYISPFEHNAVTRVLHSFEEKAQIHVIQLKTSDDLVYDMEGIRYQFEKERPDLVIMSHVSNVIGLISPVAEVFRLAKGYGATTVVDMAQSAGLVNLAVGQETVDFAVFAGHKTLYGPTGISGFLMKPSFDLPPVLFGGTGYDSANQNMPDSLPERYEMGTLNTSGIAGLNAALCWIEEVGSEKLLEVEVRNRQRLIDLFERYWFLRVVGNSAAARFTGIVSCVMDGISSDSAGQVFDQQGISVRTGLQCAPLAHQFLRTFPAGTIRFSTSFFTSEADYEELQNALDYIAENL